MNSFEFEYNIHVQVYGVIARSVKMTRTGEGVKVHADDAELESVDLIAPNSYAEFNKILGAAPDSDIIDSARAMVAAGKPSDVERAVRDVGKRLFSWADSGSGFYGFGQTENCQKQPTPYSY